MSLDKAVEHGKERRKPYRGAKAVDATCRNHGSCEWCRHNRLHSRKKSEVAAEQDVNSYIDDSEAIENG